MKFRKRRLVLLLILSILVCLIQFPVSAAGSARALLIQVNLPWGSPVNTDILNRFVSDGRLASYDVHSFAEAGADGFDLSVYSFIIVADVQGDTEYSQYTPAVKGKFEAYTSAGGVILFGACDRNNLAFSTALPGGVTRYYSPQFNNYIVDSSNPVVTGILSGSPALIDSDLLGYACSHIAFNEATFPSGTNVILRASIINLPTLIEYPIGSGHIIASGLTWEYGASNNLAYATKAYDDLFLYALSLSLPGQDAPTGLTGITPLTPGGTDGKITGSTTAMEYKLQTDTSYTPAPGTEITGLAAGIYDVRFAEKEGYSAGKAAAVTVNDAQAAPTGLLGTAPLTYGGTDGKITGTTAAMEYKLSAESIYLPATDTEITGLAAGTYSVRFAAKTGFDAGTDATVTVNAGPNASQGAPAGLAIIPASSDGTDGKITGVTSQMEYRLSTVFGYTPISGTEITGLVMGVYYVRFAAKPGYDAGADASAAISAVISATVVPTAAPTAAATASATPATAVAGVSIVKTGENDNSLLYGLLLFIASGTAVSVVVWRAKKKSAV